MGLFSRAPKRVEAQLKPAVRNDVAQFAAISTPITRQQAMSVPTIARCRNLIVGVPATAPLKLWKDDQELPKMPWLDQPCANQASAVTMAWTYDSLFFYGVSYWQVVEEYADDHRPSRFVWVANNRVSWNTNAISTVIEQYFVDGYTVPMAGIGSLITIQGLDEGILNRGSVTIRAAYDLQNAAAVAAKTPFPAGELHNIGADLEEHEVIGLLAKWREARNNNSVAYTSSVIEFKPTQFSPKDMMYVEAIQNMALEVARMCNVEADYVSAEIHKSMTYTNMQDRRRDFVANTLQPYITAVEGRLSMNDLTANGQSVKVDLDESFLRANALDRLAVIAQLLTLGLIDIPTAQDMEDLAPMRMPMTPASLTLVPDMNDNDAATTP
jgi:phage portal protein BeeE